MKGVQKDKKEKESLTPVKDQGFVDLSHLYFFLKNILQNISKSGVKNYMLREIIKTQKTCLVSISNNKPHAIKIKFSSVYIELG